MSTRITIKQRIPDIPEVAVLRQEVPLHRIIISRSQVLAPDIRIIALRIERILIIILRASESRIAKSVVAVRLPQISL